VLYFHDTYLATKSPSRECVKSVYLFWTLLPCCRRRTHCSLPSWA